MLSKYRGARMESGSTMISLVGDWRSIKVRSLNYLTDWPEGEVVGSGSEVTVDSQSALAV